jgi:hypothetical protein
MSEEEKKRVGLLGGTPGGGRRGLLGAVVGMPYSIVAGAYVYV